MSYNYQTLQEVALEIAKDPTTENIFDQMERLTTDELRLIEQTALTMADAAAHRIRELHAGGAI